MRDECAAVKLSDITVFIYYLSIQSIERLNLLLFIFLCFFFTLNIVMSRDKIYISQ